MVDLKNNLVAPSPLTVPVSENETDEQFLDRWRKVDALSAEKKEILFSELTIEKIEDVSKRFRLTYEEVCDISRLVRAIVCGEIDISQADLFLKQKIQHIEQVDRDSVKNIIVEILSQQPVVPAIEEKIEQKKQMQLSLSAALAQYPRLGEQGITSSQLKLQYSAELVRPSIKNWIKDYQNNFGAVKHSPIDRGNFLFHSENGKRLSSFDRQKLATVLKSLDDQTLLTIDVEAQIVIFNGMQEEQRVERVQEVGREQIEGIGKVGMQQAKRDVRAEINLKREDDRQNIPSRDFFVKPASAGLLQNIGSVPSPASTRGESALSGTFSQVEKGEPKKTLEGDNFFSIPTSKPPIGSDEYQLERNENKNVSSISEHLAFGKEPIDESELLTGQKIKSNSNVFVSPNNISFSSPQKLPTEQAENVEDFSQQQAAQKNLARSLYHIAPSKHVEEGGEPEFKTANAGPKISGNVVDLRQ